MANVVIALRFVDGQLQQQTAQLDTTGFMSAPTNWYPVPAMTQAEVDAKAARDARRAKAWLERNELVMRIANIRYEKRRRTARY